MWLVNKAEALQDFNATYSAMEDTLGRVYAALGNHDTAPLTLFQYSQLPSEYHLQWAYDALTSDWLALTGIPSVETANHYGSYSAIHPNSNLRIIS
ncbi:uncharacterized protein N7483_012093 [Penicillium malachiteum]|uniref:uncharacterized protein n=1 Tax=Penicillium malachiteum TaxID=1324776 RepID=UPI002547736C|nr:uncharacterized protein N7483_012093 [Penicillium malachiteum]KAJ5714912.1 hypothetical protein N7483_012093 [Penicillium malachiteum]